MIPSRQREDTGFPTSISMKLDQSHRDLGSPTADNTDDVVLYDDEDSEDLSSISSFEEEEAEWKVIMEKIGDWLPSLEIVNTVKQYISRPDKWSVLMDDLIAALVLLVMLIPQGMAYASLAGMPPKYGLTSAALAPIAYGLFGTSRHVSPGPTAIVALLTAEILEQQGFVPQTDNYVTAALRLAFYIGVLEIILALIHAGEVASFLSNSVVKGFTTAASIVIASTQLSKLFGVEGKQDPAVYNVWIKVFGNIDESNPETIYLAIENLVLLFGLKFLKSYMVKYFQNKQKTSPKEEAKKYKIFEIASKAFPHYLVVVILNIIFVIAFNLDDKGVKTVGALERGWVPTNNIFGSGFSDQLGNMIPGVLTITLIGFLESISGSKVVAIRFGYTVDSSQEFMGLGASNIIAPLGIFPGTGCLPRTAVSADTGGKTQAATILSGLLLIVVIFSILPWFESLPDVTLASIIISGVVGMIDIQTPRKLWSLEKTDFLVWLATFVCTLALGVEAGVAFGTILSLIFVLKVSARPHYALLGRVKHGSGLEDDSMPIYRNVRDYGYDKTIEDPHVRIVRFDSQLFFANSEFFQDKISDFALPEIDWSHHKIVKEPPRSVMIDMGSIASIDATSIDILYDLPAVIEKKCIGSRYWTLRQLNRQLKRAERELEVLEEEEENNTKDIRLRHMHMHIDGISSLLKRFSSELTKLESGLLQIPIVSLVNVRTPVLRKLRQSRRIRGIRPTRASKKKKRERGNSSLYEGASFWRVESKKSSKWNNFFKSRSRKYSDNVSEDEISHEESVRDAIPATTSKVMMRSCSMMLQGTQHITLCRHRSSRIILLMDRLVETSLDVHQGVVELHQLFQWPFLQDCEKPVDRTFPKSTTVPGLVQDARDKIAEGDEDEDDDEENEKTNVVVNNDTVAEENEDEQKKKVSFANDEHKEDDVHADHHQHAHEEGDISNNTAQSETMDAENDNGDKQVVDDV